MPRNVTGETYALIHADELMPKEWGPGARFEEWWPKAEARVAQFSHLVEIQRLWHTHC